MCETHFRHIVACLMIPDSFDLIQHAPCVSSSSVQKQIKIKMTPNRLNTRFALLIKQFNSRNHVINRDSLMFSFLVDRFSLLVRFHVNHCLAKSHLLSTLAVLIIKWKLKRLSASSIIRLAQFFKIIFNLKFLLRFFFSFEFLFLLFVGVRDVLRWRRRVRWLWLCVCAGWTDCDEHTWWLRSTFTNSIS